jgi:hypothetical protein
MSRFESSGILLVKIQDLPVGKNSHHRSEFPVSHFPEKLSLTAEGYWIYESNLLLLSTVWEEFLILKLALCIAGMTAKERKAASDIFSN